MVVGAERLSAAALHEAFGDAFSDYLIGPFALALDAWPAFLARQCADLGLSRAVVDDDHFEPFRGEGLREQRVDAAQEQVGPLVRRDDDRNARVALWRALRRRRFRAHRRGCAAFSTT